MRTIVSADDVRTDLDELIAAFKDLHPQPFWSQSEQQIRQRAARIVAQADAGTLCQAEFFRQAAQLVIAFDDPHSWLMTPGYAAYRDSGGLILPMELRIDGPTATVRFAPPSSAIPAGAKLLRINGESVADLIAEFRPLTGQPDDPFGDEFLATFFGRYLWYFRGWADRFDVEYESAGRVERAQLVGVTKAQLAALMSAATTGTAEQSLASATAPLAYRPLGQGTALLEFRACADPEVIRGLCERIFAQVRADGITALVIDARDNTGGGDAAWITLLEYLTDKPFSAYFGSRFRISQRLKDLLGQEGVRMGYGEDAWPAPNGTEIIRTRGPDDLLTPPPNEKRFTGRWAVMAGRRTFSSGMSFVCAVKAFGLAPVIGGETGGRIKGFGQWVAVKLPRSRITAAISTKQFDGAIDAPYRQGVKPDVQVAEAAQVVPNSSDDPVLSAALNVLTASK